MTLVEELHAAAHILRRHAPGPGFELHEAMAEVFDAVAKAARFGDDMMARVGYSEVLRLARVVLGGGS